MDMSHRKTMPLAAGKKTTHPLVSFLWHQAQNDWFHCGYISEPDLWNVEGADHVSPTPVVGSFQTTVFVWAQLTTLKMKDMLRKGTISTN